MTTAVAVIDRGVVGVTVHELQARREKILEVLANVLEEGKDYGRIPGTGEKPSLYKPGAETILSTFELAAVQPTVEDLGTADSIRYRLSLPIEAPGGRVLGVGVGEASTDEEKYRWRKVVCDEEYDEAQPHLRREKWFRGQSKPYKVKQVRTSPADLANTVLKMAHKRALIHGTLLATGASSVFNQDLEDFSKELREAVVDADAESTTPKEVKRASETGGKRPTSTVAPTGVEVTQPLTVNTVREAVDRNDKKFWVLVLNGDPFEYTTRDATQASELQKFKGTDHKLRVSFIARDSGGKTYRNIQNFAIADADTPTTPREPGEDG